MSIFQKLNQLETIVDGVLTPDREQNHKILIRQIRDELNINMDKTMNDILNHPIIKPYIKPKETYMVTASLNGEFGGYLSQIDPCKFAMDYNLAFKCESPKIASGLIDLINSKGNQLICGIVSLTAVQEYDLKLAKEDKKYVEIEEAISKDELVNKMHNLITNGENIPADTFKEWNEFIENC